MYELIVGSHWVVYWALNDYFVINKTNREDNILNPL